MNHGKLLMVMQIKQ